MKSNPAARPSAEIRQLGDQTLRQQAMLWRVQALRGDLEAHKIARVFELEELRRLQRPPGLTTLSPFLPIDASRPWWKFW